MKSGLIALLALLTPPALAQRPSTLGTQGTPGTRVLRGVVVTANDTPLPRVRVALESAPRSGTLAQQPPDSLEALRARNEELAALELVLATQLPVLTDERGQFTVRVPNVDSVFLRFSKARYAAISVNVGRNDSNAQSATDLRVRLTLGGAISGQVRDQNGGSVMQAVVTARRLSPASAADQSELRATTNDLGEFRFGGLVAGAYSVGLGQVLTGAGTELKTPEEQTVNVSLGSEVAGIDLRVDAPSELVVRNTVTKPAGPDATGSVRGRVATSTGVPIAGATVQAYGAADSFLPAVESDARGRYVIDRMPPGDYRVLAFKRGYITPEQGQAQNAAEILSMMNRTGRDRIVPIRRGQAVESVDLILGRGASIAGTILDEFGEPMQDVVVNALVLRAMGGRIRALRASSVGSNGRTDDRGRYRIFGLQPGTYVTQAVAGDVLSGTNGYVPLFYPGTSAIDQATPTKLDIDAAAAGIDLTLQPQPTRRVRGSLVDVDGNPMGIRDGLFDRAGMSATVMVTLTASAPPGGIQTEPVRTASKADGTFAFNNIAPGNYIVQAAVNGPAVSAANVPTSQQFAEAVVTVAGDDPPPIELRLSRGATLMGHVVYEGIAESFPPYAGIQMMVVPAAADRDPLLAASSNGFALLSDNTFEYRGIFGPSVVSVRPRNANWYVKSITYRGQDLADSAFDFGVTETFRDVDILISGAGAMVTGRVTDDRAVPVRDYTVALIPTDRSKWTFRSRWFKTARAMSDGAFQVTGIVPGDYWVIAVNRLDGSEVAGDLQNPEVLAALASRAQRITLGEGQSPPLTLRLVRR